MKQRVQIVDAPTPLLARHDPRRGMVVDLSDGSSISVGVESMKFRYEERDGQTFIVTEAVLREERTPPRSEGGTPPPFSGPSPGV